MKIAGFAFAEVRKAFAGGVAGATAFVTASLLAGKGINGELVAGAAGAFVAGAVLVFFVKNAPAATKAG